MYVKLKHRIRFKIPAWPWLEVFWRLQLCAWRSQLPPLCQGCLAQTLEVSESFFVSLSFWRAESTRRIRRKKVASCFSWPSVFFLSHLQFNFLMLKLCRWAPWLGCQPYISQTPMSSRALYGQCLRKSVARSGCSSTMHAVLLDVCGQGTQKSNETHSNVVLEDMQAFV